MDARRLHAGEWIVLLGSVALIVLLFLDWYAVDGRGRSAWAAFGVLDLILAALALLGITFAVLSAVQPSPALPVAAGVMTMALAPLAGLLLLYRLLDPPGAGDVQVPAVLGLAAVAGTCAGAWLALRDEVRTPPGGPVPPPPARSVTPPGESEPAPSI